MADVEWLKFVSMASTERLTLGNTAGKSLGVKSISIVELSAELSYYSEYLIISLFMKGTNLLIDTKVYGHFLRIALFIGLRLHPTVYLE